MTSEPFISPTRNRWMAYALTGLVAAMVALSFAAVPLYQIFCKATGYGGTTQVATENPKGVIDREVTVRFDSNVDGALPWTVTPSKPITDKIGTTTTINFVAVNNSDKPTTGQAIFNVQPDKAGLYFNKIECFCFTQQTLQPHQRVEMPVVFFVDPDMAKDHDLDYTRDITLSYTFYAENK
jgi:cytochrome c oxidase assembly protein subunit 11